MQDIDRNPVDAYRLPKPEGALITQVSPNSPAQKAGLRAGDVILKLNGASVLRTSDLLYALNKVQPNQTVQFEVLRDDKTRNISATLATAPDETPATGNQTSASKGPVLGMSIRDLAVPEKNALGIKGGIYVQDVRRGGLASLSNIIPGDVIIQVNNTQILNSQDFAKVVSNLPKNTVARVGIIRQGQRAMLGLRIQ